VSQNALRIDRPLVSPTAQHRASHGSSVDSYGCGSFGGTRRKWLTTPAGFIIDPIVI